MPGPLPTCDPSVSPYVASRSSIFTPRRAVDPSGRIGLFYDACCDQVIQNSKRDFHVEKVTSKRAPTCQMEQLHTNKSLNFLDWCTTSPELRLSIALGMVPVEGTVKLINYCRPIDEYTRVLSYEYYSRTDYVSDDEFKKANTNRVPIPNTDATHVIVLVNWRIDTTILIQLPHDHEIVSEIDYALNKLCGFLSDGDEQSMLSIEDENRLKKIVHTEVFSNVPELAQIKSVLEFYDNIQFIKNDADRHQPYNYNLCPIEHLYILNNKNQNVFVEIRTDKINMIENYLLEFSVDIRRLKVAMEQDFPNLQRHPNEDFNQMKTRWTELVKTYKDQIEQLKNLVIAVRRKITDHKWIDQVLNGKEATDLRSAIQQLPNLMNKIKEKEHFIEKLLRINIQYLNVLKYDIKGNEDEKKIEQILMQNSKQQAIICSNDDLYRNKRSHFDKNLNDLIKQNKDNSQWKIIYADFSDCSNRLKDFIILPLSKIDDHIERATTAAARPRSTRVRRDDCINILLLGESGVGKSTFINAIVNYLHFNTLDDAESSESIVLMPVSFIMTTGDDFKEHLVEFRGEDTVSNEDCDHPGQSVTLHCKSYIITLPSGQYGEKKFRIIDTPGVGDTRGTDQDDFNMEHILSLICNLTHLNAVCILLKPNNERIGISVRSCFMQLFDLLGENARDKIIFCFTNSRSTFYTVGNTASLLKELLKSLSVSDVVFGKENTFCFDSEAFRYLVAKRNGIEFDQSEKTEFEQSWNKSSKESKRFIEYICMKMTKSVIPAEWKSTKYEQLQIHLMIRPILETMRNILRNIILLREGSNKVSIELCPKIIKGPTAICLKCERGYHQVGKFWITADSLHVCANRCRTCMCPLTEHVRIHHELQYKVCNNQASDSIDKMTDMLNDICNKCAEFSEFLFKTRDVSKNDLFLREMNRMIWEEKNICDSKSECQLNSKLHDELKKLKETYEVSRKKMADEQRTLKLSSIYDKMEEIMKYPMIESQMKAVVDGEKFMIKYYEYEVPIQQAY